MDEALTRDPDVGTGMEMMMDYEALKAGLQQAVPLNKYLGLQIVELAAGRGVVMLPDRAELKNHVGSQHAAALFAAGEAASGAAFIAAFAGRLAEITPLAQSAQIAYTRIARGPITAIATLEDGDAHQATLDRDGKVAFDVPVAFADAEDRPVATMTVRWHVAKSS